MSFQSAVRGSTAIRSGEEAAQLLRVESEVQAGRNPQETFIDEVEHL
jgi:hypothetical protein